MSSNPSLYAYRTIRTIALIAGAGYFASVIGGWNPGGIFFTERWTAVTWLGVHTQDALAVVAVISYVLWLAVGFTSGRILYPSDGLAALALGLLFGWFVGLYAIFALSSGPVLPL